MRIPVINGYTAREKIRKNPGGDTAQILTLTASAFCSQRDTIHAGGFDELLEISEKLLGVRCRMQDQAAQPADTDASVVQNIPQAPLAQLGDAAARLNPALCKQTIARIGTYQSDLADALTTRAGQFDFAAVSDIVAQPRGQNSAGDP